MEQTWIPLLSVWTAIDRIVDGLVVVVKLRQTVLGLECAYKVLRWFVEVPSARPHAPYTIEHIAPVGASVGGVVFLVVRSLYCKYTLLTVLFFRKEDVTIILKIAIVGVVLHHLGVFYHLLHIFFVDMVVAVGSFVAITIGKCKIALGKV